MHILEESDKVYPKKYPGKRPLGWDAAAGFELWRFQPS